MFIGVGYWYLGEEIIWSRGWKDLKRQKIMVFYKVYLFSRWLAQRMKTGHNPTSSLLQTWGCIRLRYFIWKNERLAKLPCFPGPLSSLRCLADQFTGKSCWVWGLSLEETGVLGPYWPDSVANWWAPDSLRDSASKNKVMINRGRSTVDLWSPHAHICMHIHAGMHMYPPNKYTLLAYWN